MQAPPLLTDRAALIRNRARAARAPALFLHDEVLLDAQERLSEVNKSFTKPVIVTGQPTFWQAAFPTATVVPDHDTLPLTPGSHDLVIHALSLHWANDPVGQLVQCRRALRPDGLFLGYVFGGQTLVELRAALAQAESEVTGGLSPRVLPMAEIRDLGGLLQRAGFALPVADSMTRITSYRSLSHLMSDLRAMGEQNALAARLRRPTVRGVFQRAAEIYQEAYGNGTGRIRATFDIQCLTGWAPHDSQQKPLRPGSAARNLADALDTTEMPLPRDPAKG
jgi:SAM-dependent methyltransferase